MPNRRHVPREVTIKQTRILLQSMTKNWLEKKREEGAKAEKGKIMETESQPPATDVQPPYGY